MNEYVRNLVDWCTDQRKGLLQGIALMEAGTFHTREQSGGGEMIDTTDATLADYRRKVEELDDLLGKIKADYPDAQ